MIPMLKKSLWLVVLTAAAVSLTGCNSPSTEAPAVSDGPFVRYSVSGSTVTIAAAVTPFAAQSKESEAFLRWFKRGFETGYSGGAPLMIEWDETPVAKAGRRGYEFGLEEGEKVRKEGPAHGQSLRTVPIPPGL